MIALRLILLICVLATLVHGQTVKNNFRHDNHLDKSTTATASTSDYRQLSLADCVGTPDEYEGKLVAVTAEVVSVDAKYQAIKLFDTHTKTLMGVSLTRLTKAQRRSLVQEPVLRVSVYGSIAKQAGHYIIEAHKVVPLSSDTAMHESGR